jgi:hypothetical protein
MTSWREPPPCLSPSTMASKSYCGSMVSDFLVSHGAQSMGHYQSSGNGVRGWDCGEREATAFKGVGLAKTRSSYCWRWELLHSQLLTNTNTRPTLTEQNAGSVPFLEHSQALCEQAGFLSRLPFVKWSPSPYSLCLFPHRPSYEVFLLKLLTVFFNWWLSKTTEVIACKE